MVNINKYVNKHNIILLNKFYLGQKYAEILICGPLPTIILMVL